MDSTPESSSSQGAIGSGQPENPLSPNSRSASSAEEGLSGGLASEAVFSPPEAAPPVAPDFRASLAGPVLGQQKDSPDAAVGLTAQQANDLSAQPSQIPGKPIGWAVLRWSLWLLLLAGAVGLWAVAQRSPQFADQLAYWIAQLQYSSISESQREAEQAAAQALRQAGALVIDEGPLQGVTCVHVTTPQALSDELLGQLERLVRLNSLNFLGMPLRDRRLLYVAKARSVASLVLNETPITDAGLAHLAPLEQLEVLHLRKTAITDAGLAHLAALRSLKVLVLSETQVTDEGLAHLKDLPDLRWLLLDGTAVTDAGLKHLEALPRLSQLNLRRCHVSQEGIARLKKVRPHLFVDHR